MSNYWLGLDCGGSWLKAGLYDGAGREVAVQRLPLHALSPQPGWVEPRYDRTVATVRLGHQQTAGAHGGERFTNPWSGYFSSG